MLDTSPDVSRLTAALTSAWPKRISGMEPE
jgi:hypothetical protein